MIMVSLTIRFKHATQMAKWVDDMIDAQVLPASASIRMEDALDAPTKRYVLDGGRDGGRKVQMITRTEETVEVTSSMEGK